MNKVIIDDNFMSEANKKYVDQFILGSDYPYYIQENSVENDNHIYMVHTAVTRPEGHDPSYPVVNSSESTALLEILYDFVEKHKINCTRILRCAVNISLNNGFEKTASHVDHKYKHKSLLVYCTDNPEASTVLEKDNKIYKQVETKKYRGLYFEDYKHYLKYPKKDIRVVIVFTFK